MEGLGPSFYMKIILLISIFLSLFFLTPLTAKGAVIINEIAWMGTENSSNDEWIELRGDQQADLTGWVLEAADGTPTINLEGIISADGYFLLERTDDDSVHNIVADQIYTGALSNSGEHLILKDSDNNIIDEINSTEEWPAGDNSTKKTMQKVNSEWGTGNPTPKAVNNISLEEIDPGEEENLSGPEISQTIPLNNSTDNQPPIADAGNDTITFIDEEITFDGSESYDPDGLDLAYEWNLGEGGVKEDIIVTHKYSYPGTYLITLMVFDGRYYTRDTVTIKVYPKKITINEFLPSPIGKDAEEEWIELYNDSDEIVNISGWQLDDEDGGSKPFTFPENTLIAPKGFLVFSRQTTNVALNNDSDKVRLLLSTGMVFQEVNYEKAPEGQSSARTPKGFIWSSPTPGLPNVVITEKQIPEYEGSFQSETTGQASEKTTLSNKNTKNSIKGGWQELPKDNQPTEDRNYYNLANLQESTNSNNKLILIILTIATTMFAVVIGFIKLKKKI